MCNDRIQECRDAYRVDDWTTTLEQLLNVLTGAREVRAYVFYFELQPLRGS